MSTWLATKRLPAPSRAQHTPHFLMKLLLALMMAGCLGIFLGAGLALANANLPAASPTLTFTTPNSKGLIGGPPGAKTTVRGTGWTAYSSVNLFVKPGIGACDSGVALGSFPIDGTGSLAAVFLWPPEANRLDQYYVCGAKSGKSIIYSQNTFTVLASAAPTLSATPASAFAGDTLTVTGSNWVPGPQTVSLIILPCSSLCSQKAVANGQVVTAQNGTFSLKMTLAPSAPGGAYYIQANNGQATLSAVSSAIQVTGQTGETPTSGSPTSATSSGQGNGTPPTANNTLPALKDALIAAAVGIVALALLIGGGVFFLRIARSGGAASPRGRQRTPGRHPQRFPSNDANQKPPASDWHPPLRPSYPSDRFALPPVAGRVRQEAQVDEPEIVGQNIWEGVARTAPDTIEMPGVYYMPASRSAPEQDAPSGRPEHQIDNGAMAEDPTGVPHRSTPPAFRPHRPQQPLNRSDQQDEE